MTMLETFGDAISSLQTDSNGTPVKPSELEIAHTLFTNIADNYGNKEKDKESSSKKVEPFQAPAIPFKQLLKKAVAVALLVLLFAVPWVRNLIEKYTNNNSITYAVIFFMSLVLAFVIIKKV
jgi:hypothetical protein